MLSEKKIKTILLMSIGFLLVFSSGRLQANLDGTGGSALYMSSTYTFTNGEFARGYVQFKQGFNLPAGGTAFIGVNAPVSGVINLNGGTLVMQDDMHLASDATIVGDGTIIGNNWTMYLGADLVISSAINFISNTADNYFKLDGRGNRVIFTALQTPTVGFTMGADSDPFVTYISFSNLSLINVIGGNNTYPFRNGKQSNFIFKDVSFSIPPQAGLANNLFLGGTALFQGINSVVGQDSIFGLNGTTPLGGPTGGTFTLDVNSTLYIGPTNIFTLRFTTLLFNSVNSILSLDNCRMQTLGTTQFLNGTVRANGLVQLFPINLLIFGDGISSSNNCDLLILAGSRVDFLRAIQPNTVEFRNA